MVRYTRAYSRFVDRLPEVEMLCRLARQQLRSEGPLRGARMANPLCRAGVVLLSSHIEGYVEDLSDIILHRVYESRTPKQALAPRFLYYFSKDLIDEINDTRDPDKISVKMRDLFERDKDIWSSNSEFQEELLSERFASGFSTPKFNEIRRFVARFGYGDYRQDMGRHLEAKFRPCINMVDNVVDQRNKIAHGDAIATATPSDLASMLHLVRLFCRSTDVVVGNWFRTIGCSIR